MLAIESTQEGARQRMDSNADYKPEQAEENELARGTNQGGMRERNERVVLTLLRRHPNIAKAEIARRTGLSAQTVARLINALERDGFILQGARSKGRIGQPATPLSLNPKGAAFYGLKVGRRSVELVLIDLMGNIIDREKVIYDYPDYKTVLGFTMTAAQTLRARLPAAMRSKIGGMGIAMPFFLWSWADSIGVDASLMADWKDRSLQDEIAAGLDLPVFVQNDATSACSAELVFGRDTLPANTLCIYIAFFIGAGLVLNNGLYTGTSGNAAGFGPLQVLDRSAVPRSLIDLASLKTLENLMAQEGLDAQSIWLDAEEWDIPEHILSRWTEDCAYALAQGVRAAQTMLDLDLVMIDGWMPRALTARLTERIEQHLAALDLTGMYMPRLSAGTLGPDARVVGAASLPLSHRFLLS